MMAWLGAAVVGTLTLGQLPVPVFTDEHVPLGARQQPARESPEWRVARAQVFGVELPAEKAVFPTAVAAASANGPDAAVRCALTSGHSDLASSASCLECHGGAGATPGSSHPVNVDYAAVQARRPGALRLLDAVVARGVFLPNGVLQCTTCHDARSPWKDHIALPPGQTPRPAVNPRKPETYLNRPNWRLAATSSGASLPPGSAVTPAPLCAACHTVGD
jgi:hypothetical protein